MFFLKDFSKTLFKHIVEFVFVYSVIFLKFFPGVENGNMRFYHAVYQGWEILC